MMFNQMMGLVCVVIAGLSGYLLFKATPGKLLPRWIRDGDPKERGISGPGSQS